MDLAARRAQLIAELEPFGDHHERFQYVIDRAKSTAALAAALEAGRCRFRCDADSLITKGVATLVCEFYDGASPGEVAATDADFLAAVGITQHLSPNRRNGLTNLVAKIRAFGRAAGG